MSYLSTILITGTSSGLGFGTAIKIARARPNLRVVICSRTGADCADKINAMTGHSNVVYLPLDLSTHADTRSFVKEYTSRDFPKISSLVLNAGIQLTDKLHISPDGIESMFAINHVNQALLFFLLRPRLLPDARIVFISSGMHSPDYYFKPGVNYISANDMAHPSESTMSPYNRGLKIYAETKIANLLFAYALHHRSSKFNIMALDPGVMASGLHRHQPGIRGSVTRFAIRSLPWLISDSHPIEVPATALAKLAIDPEFASREKNGGKYYYVDLKDLKSSEQTYDTALQNDLWDWTIQKVAQGDEKTTFAAL
ncbi:MAG: hypothetical protein TREMPRED_000022 [Tremellales sp. Tagirdzhanova-0007]|nr:MAG: hypothetical protein TREMPRED_000022 [Tremellales sp. Tagirdzhanova-0007]